MSTLPSEGVIKFKFNLKISKPLDESLYIKIEKWRVILYKMNFIGEYPEEKVGFGNLSQRIKSGENQFIITGTQTGKEPHLNGSKYTKVVKCDMSKMAIEAIGPIAPSSESITHYAIYHTAPQVNCIFHVHHNELWNFMLQNDFAHTSKDIEYGTKEMANAMKNCINNNKSGVFAMSGHEDGVISYGSTPEEAGKILLDTLKECRK